MHSGNPMVVARKTVAKFVIGFVSTWVVASLFALAAMLLRPALAPIPEAVAQQCGEGRGAR